FIADPSVPTCTPTPDISTLSLHDALPISDRSPTRSRRPTGSAESDRHFPVRERLVPAIDPDARPHAVHPERVVLEDFPDFLFVRSEEHTSELQSRENLVCRLLLEKKKQTQ